MENFTTEALAAAIRAAPGPFVEALRASGVSLPAETITVRSVQTQVGVVTAGILDLILVHRGGGQEIELWFEVTCYATESGNQLANYSAHIAARPAELRPVLVVLARTPLVGHDRWRGGAHGAIVVEEDRGEETACWPLRPLSLLRARSHLGPRLPAELVPARLVVGEAEGTILPPLSDSTRARRTGRPHSVRVGAPGS